MGIYEGPNVIPIIPYSHYYLAGGPPKVYMYALRFRVTLPQTVSIRG